MHAVAITGVSSAVAAFTGAAAVAFAPLGFDPGSVAVTAAGLVVTGIVAAAGFLADRGRWPWLLGASVVTFDWSWAGHAGWPPVTIAAAAAAAVTAVLGAASWRRRYQPSRSAGHSPAAATALATLLVPWPVAVGIAAGGDFTWRHAAAAAGGWTLVVLYSRAVRLSWLLVRVGAPLLGALAALGSPLPSAAPVVALTLTVAAVAFTTAARTAVTQPAVAAAGFTLPPELTPTPVLDEAGLDPSGRRRR
ncbi:MAG: hypothetical protein ACE5E8_10915 [Acidimicrobiia bacterium]